MDAGQASASIAPLMMKMVTTVTSSGSPHLWNMSALPDLTVPYS